MNVVIIGGGIVGQFTAYYLSKNNHDVTIIDDGSKMPPASHGNCGLITPSHVLPMNSWKIILTGLKWLGKKDAPLSIKPQLDSTFIKWFVDFARYSTTSSINKIAQGRHELLQSSWKLYQDFLQNEKVNVGFKHEGLVYVCKNPEGLKGVRHEYEAQARMGLKATMLSKDELISMEPSLSEQINGGAIFNVDGWLDPRRLLDEIKRINFSSGVKFIGGKVSEFDLDKNGIRTAITSNASIEGEEFVLSAGVFSTKLASKLKLNIPMIPGKGYNLTSVSPIPNQPKRPIYMFERKVVATPWDTGFRLGSTMEFSGFDLSLNKHRLDALKRAGNEYLKLELDSTEFEPWAGFRAMTANGLPIISRSEKHKNLILATGHGMLGLTWAPATGHLVSELISNR